MFALRKYNKNLLSIKLRNIINIYTIRILYIQFSKYKILSYNNKTVFDIYQ